MIQQHETDIPDITKRYMVLKVHGNTTSQETAEVCTESRAIITLNGAVIGDLSITPMDLEPFALGYLICEGYIRSPDAIEKIAIHLPHIDIITKTSVNSVLGSFSRNSSGGSCRDLLPDGIFPPLDDGLILKGETIFQSMNHVHEYSVIWKRTGGMHCSLIMDSDGNVISGVEDMGRHTTVDKAVGMALMKGADLRSCYIVCSGRLPVDMVAKAYRAGISVMVSNNAAFAGGIEFAQKTNMTLAGFVRPPYMTIYTGSHRIRFESS
ncbi:MAG TPA: formate dehydrogenase accessory sulfurtransferase FdhD [Methanospirillum sp.]|nr:formate dehydrogenase accessory sulfurtransferase FdhD [Methanospirillum sp.]